MAGHDYLNDPKNPFFSLEDDIDDEAFLQSAPQRAITNNNPFLNFDNNLEQQKQQLLERKKAVEERTIKSSERSMTLLRDSEQIGAATAEELIRQREQLERTEKRLDDINSTLRFSQKHIQGIKSVFGSLKNYLSGKSVDSPTPTLTGGKLSEPEYSGSSSSVLNDKIEESRLNLAAQHPSLQRRGLLGNDNYDDDDNGGQHYKVQSTNVSKILERNLDEMSGSLARLKGLAIGLSEEIDSQNDLIENVMTKTDKADIMLERQNKDMRHLLKK
ncbi:synaptosomal-associated protein 29 [Microplitis demolitor]|uniref:synaptosomal-associated protein 29 n=1 Tax=Microplitis demolitor TaxID=69319 RepID=UPI0004400138|nr:synaptosomal-associated protein 29 [Microplitis demolitor]